MTTLSNAQEEFDRHLAPYAVSHSNSLGRFFPEPSASDRTEFQRDATRIVHSSAFRRLQYKTQVFSNHEGDLFRTRLTHSLEVAQISKASAVALHLNEDLTETLALAHDLGHAPFGHLGQSALNEAMKKNDGFEHNFQALRIVDQLERAYVDHPGLNLLYESREGILKHCSANNAKLLLTEAELSGDVLLAKIANRFLPDKTRQGFSHKSPSLEAQLTDWCDAVAYTHADMEDAVTMNILSLDQISASIPLFHSAMDKLTVENGPPKKGDEALYAKVASGLMMKQALGDLIDHSRLAIEDSKVETIDDVRHSEAIIGFSPDFLERHHNPFKSFLLNEVYTHPDVEKWRSQQHELIRKLFSDIVANPNLVAGFDKDSQQSFHRQLCDYLANMTDRSVLLEVKRVNGLMESNSARKALVKRNKL